MIEKRTARVLVTLALFLALLIWERVPEIRTLNAINGPPTVAHEWEVKGHVPRIYAAYATEAGEIYGIEDHYLFVSTDRGHTYQRRGQLPKVNPTLLTTIKNRIARSKVVRLVRRNPGPNNLVVLKSGTILVFWDYIYRSTDGGYSFSPVYEFSEFTPPFGFSEGVAVGPEDTIYFGEYTADKRPNEIRIIRGTNDGRHWETARRFASGEIFHIHSIQYDPYREGFWTCTGDRDDESQLLFTPDHFDTLERLGGGTQDWRAVSLLITEDDLFWGSDNDRDGGSIFRWNFATEKLQKIRDIENVSYYSTVMTDGTMVLSTVYEPISPFTKSSDPPKAATVYFSANGRDWDELLTFAATSKENKWGPVRASVAFPGGAPLPYLLMTPTDTKAFDYSTLVLERRQMDPTP